MDPFKSEPEVKIVIICCYALIITTGVLGNAVVMGILIKNCEMRTMQNNLIALLAISDFLMCSLTAPTTLWNVLHQNCRYDDAVCRLVSSAQTANVFISTMCITAISLDRYFLILFPMNRRAHSLIPIFSMIVFCAIALMMTIPMILASGLKDVMPHTDFGNRLKTECGAKANVCVEDKYDWWVNYGKRIYSCFCTLFQYVLPLFGIVFMNFKISGKLQEREHRFNQPELRERTSPSAQVVRLRRVRKKASFMVAAIIITFGATWLPLNVITLVEAFGKFPNFRIQLRVFIACHVTAMLSACFNPVIYGVFNANFRRAFMQALGCRAFALRSGYQLTEQNRNDN